MTDNELPQGIDAQQSAVANPIDTIIDEAATGAQEEMPKEGDESHEANTLTPDEELKKLRNAVVRKDRRIGQLTAQKHQAFEELQQLRNKTATPAQERQIVQDNKSVPTKLNQNDFKNYADFIEARAAEIADHKIDQKFAERDSKNKNTQTENNIIAWENQRVPAVDKMAADFAKDHPDIEGMFEEHGDTIRDFPRELKHALLSADNPPLAFYNLAKDGKLEELATMPLVDARVEIRLAQMKEAAKQKTKAPVPLPTSRGAVPSGKSLDRMSGDELLKWVKS